jgi:hypothetical protein
MNLALVAKYFGTIGARIWYDDWSFNAADGRLSQMME